MKNRGAPIWMLLLLSACIATPTPAPISTIAAPYVLIAEDNPYRPKPGDDALRIASVMFNSINLVERVDLTPARVDLNLLGSLPSACNQLRVKVQPPDVQLRIFVDVYSLINPTAACDPVFQAFEADVVLGVYSPGTYTVWVNQGLIGNFVMP